MWSSLIEYHRPTTVGTALKLLTRPSPRTAPLAGGAWLVARRDPSIQAVVDLSALRLDFIERRGRRLHLGAMTTLQTLAAHPSMRQFAGGLLSEAALRTAPRPIRNLATLGGTLAVGEPTSEVALVLLVTEARMVIRAPQRRTVDLKVFFENPRKYFPSSGLILEVIIPEAENRSRAALAEVSRTPMDRPIINAAARVTLRSGMVRTARLALGGIATHPIRLPSVEAALLGQALDDKKLTEVASLVSETISPPSNERGSAEYRREMAGVVAARALRMAWKKAEKE